MVVYIYIYIYILSLQSIFINDIMPEGPEVLMLVDTIREALIGRLIISASIVNGKYLTKQNISNWDQLTVNLPLEIKAIACKGKFIYIQLQDEIAIGIGLGMTGTFNFKLDDKQNHIRLRLDNGQVLCYDDYRRFGNWQIFTTGAQLRTKLSSLGLDVIGESIQSGYDRDRARDAEVGDRSFLTLAAKIFQRYPRKNICECLMDQKIFSGIGNYIKCEALYAANIHPYAKVCNLSREELEVLYQSCLEVIGRSIRIQRANQYNYRDFRKAKTDVEAEDQVFKIYDQSKSPDKFKVRKITTSDQRNTSFVAFNQTLGLNIKIIVDVVVNDGNI